MRLTFVETAVIAVIPYAKTRDRTDRDGMGDHQGRLGQRTLHRARHPGKAGETNNVDLFDRAHADGPHGGQRTAHRPEGLPSHSVPLRRYPPTGPARRVAV